MGDWLVGLTGRQRVALLLYLAGVGVMGVSLPATFHEGYGGPTSTWNTILEVASVIYQEPDVVMVDSWAEMVDGPLPALFLLLSYFLALPGLLLWFLASRNVLFCWTARLIWPVMLIAGPLVLLLEVGTSVPEFGEGCWLWGGWVLLVSAAHWVVAPRQLSDLAPRSVPSR